MQATHMPATAALVGAAFFLARFREPGAGRAAGYAAGACPLLGDPSGHWNAWFERYGGSLPERFVVGFDNSEALHHAAVQGLGVALGRCLMAQPVVDAGRLVTLSRHRLKAGFGYSLVFLERSLEHAGFLDFRSWLYAQISKPEPQLAA